jgi:uncharacterized iron-regulated membrane protein
MPTSRTLALRRAWFQVHKWIGLILAILIIPLSLSGSALVWHDAVDRLLHPDRFAVSGGAVLAPDRYLAAARAVLKPGERIATLTMPDGANPVIVAAAPAAAPTRPGPPMRTNVYLDPPTARVLAKASNMDGIMRTVHVLHGSLLVPGVGRTIVGWLGVAMLLSSITGLWLWWPVTGSVVRGLKWKRRADTNSNLHHLLGFWIAIPLFVLSLTGVWIAFPAVFNAGGGTGPMASMRAAPLASPALAPDHVIASARTTTSGALRSIAWPTEKKADWTVTFAGRGAPRSVLVADDSGVASAAPARDTGGTARLMRRVHDGEGFGIVWQAIIFLGGLIPAILSITGIIMWWQARNRRELMAERRRGRAVAAE